MSTVSNANRRSIYNALPIVAAAYAERFDVEIEIGGNVAQTNGQKIVIPNIPESYPHMDAVWGYLAHEAAHIRYTDFNVARKRGLHADLTNIIEDSRIELEMIKLYPGTAFTLNATAEYMLNAGHYGSPDKNDHPACTLSMFILFWLQANVVGQHVLLPILEKTRAIFESAFPEGVVVRLNALLRKAASVQSTQAAADLASEIMKMIEEEQESELRKETGNQNNSDQNNGQSQQSQGQQSGQGVADSTGSEQSNPQDQVSDQDDKQNASGSGDCKNSDGQQQDKSNGQSGTDRTDQAKSGGSQSSGEAGQDSSQPQCSASQGASEAGGDQSSSKLLHSVLSAGAGETLGDVRDALKADLNAAQVDQVTTNYLTVRKAAESINDPVQGSQLLSKVASSTSKIRSQLLGLVQASQRTSSRNVRSGKRFDTNRLARLATGDTKVFRTHHERTRPNTAVHLLVDLSSSMDCPAYEEVAEHPNFPGKTFNRNVSRAEVAKRSALAIAWALEAIPGVNPGVTYFYGDEKMPVKSVLRHGQKPQLKAGHFANVYADGGTPMAESIWYSAFELSKTKEERKIMIVLTDGQPNGKTIRATHSVIERCENSGIEMFGIGIASTDVQKFFRQSIVVKDVAELQKTLFKLVERAICAPAA